MNGHDHLRAVDCGQSFPRRREPLVLSSIYGERKRKRQGKRKDRKDMLQSNLGILIHTP